jgi:hypothetical protein
MHSADRQLRFVARAMTKVDEQTKEKRLTKNERINEHWSCRSQDRNPWILPRAADQGHAGAVLVTDQGR